MGLHVIILGNPIDGFTIIGPFKTHNDAIAYGERFVNDNWWSAPLEAQS